MKFLCYRSLRHLVQAGTKYLLAFLLLGASGLIAAQEVPDFIGYCKNCSEWAFGYTAESVAPLTPGTYPVYVLDTASGEVRYFDVDVWFESGGVTHPQAAGGSSIQHHGIHKEAIPGAGDPTIISAMHDAFDLVSEFAELLYGGPITANSATTLSKAGESSIQNVSSGDLGLGFNSAIDLIGPEDSSAGLNRNALRNEINNFYNSVWGSLTSAIQDLVIRVSNRFLGDGLVDGGSITITFPDGTSIKVRLDSVAPEIGGVEFHMELDVRTDTVQGPGLSAVPQSPGQFSGFSYGGGEGIVNSLADLATRFGLSVGPHRRLSR